MRRGKAMGSARSLEKPPREARANIPIPPQAQQGSAAQPGKEAPSLLFPPTGHDLPGLLRHFSCSELQGTRPVKTSCAGCAAVLRQCPLGPGTRLDSSGARCRGQSLPAVFATQNQAPCSTRNRFWAAGPQLQARQASTKQQDRQGHAQRRETA